MGNEIFCFLCYTLGMQANQHTWDNWARRLDDWGLKALAAALLESSLPLHVVAAQVFSLSQPLWSGILAEEHASALMNVLENDAQMQALICWMREE